MYCKWSFQLLLIGLHVTKVALRLEHLLPCQQLHQWRLRVVGGTRNESFVEVVDADRVGAGQ